MLFQSSLYGFFLAVTYVIFWLTRDHKKARSLFLLGASYFFYAYGTYETSLAQNVPLGPIPWTLLCFGIIFVGSTLDYRIGIILGRTQTTWKRKCLLFCSIFYYLSVLCIFKYFNFFVENLLWFAKTIDLPIKPIHIHLALPFGISFFTFETMSYTIDVYRKEITPAKSYINYLLFVAFFPHLVAGPIVRPQSMLSQFSSSPKDDPDDRALGLFLIAKGLFKKIVISDFLAMNLVTRVFDNPERFSGLEVWIAVYAYSFQLYNDFSGYTDIALGSAKLLGYELNLNFDRPYQSWNLQVFWRKWHISLSTWLRDYLYIPLGGSKGGSLKTYFNLMVTMVLGGLWHGASWNFVIWGGLHGAALSLTRFYQRIKPTAGEPKGWKKYLQIALTYHYVCFAWIFFKTSSISHAALILERMATFDLGRAHLSFHMLLVLLFAAFVHWSPKTWLERIKLSYQQQHVFAQGFILALCLLFAHSVQSSTLVPFAYGQF